jgi:glutaminyl-tRNA synthetase
LLLVQEKYGVGWDDPRMPTISGLRRRGYSADSVINFAEIVGVAKRDAMTDIALLEFAVREDLNKKANRVMGVLDPIKVVLTNYPKDQIEELEAINNPEDSNAGKRILPFSNELYIESTDFMEVPPKGFHRLVPGGEVRLRYAYIIKCEEVIKDESGKVVELHCTYDIDTKSGVGTSTKKVKGTIHWVSAGHAIDAEIRLYDRLFNVEDPASEKDKDYLELLNPNSLVVLEGAKLEPSLKDAKVGEHYQFERTGYFCVDSKYSSGQKLVFNRTVTLRDSWTKKEGKS